MRILTMKIIMYIHDKPAVLTLFLFITTLIGCSQNDWENDMETSADSPILTIAVSDDGYEPPEGTNTRAATNEYYQTVFEEGDAIGIFGMQPYSEYGPEFIMKNTKLTLTKAGERLVWKTELSEGESDPLTLLSSDAVYFAYYPYNKKIKDIWREDYYCENAETFFSNEIENWLSGTAPYATNPTLQNDQASYSAKDLMISKGIIEVIDGIKTLKFSMKHALNMVVIDFSGINTLSTTSLPIFDGFSPYKYDTEKNIYRYLVPIGKKQTLSGRYTTTENGASADKTWDFTFNHTGTAGTYNVYTIKTKDQNTLKI